MRILHTADWHLGDRLGRIDRTDDLRQAVERVADYCRSERVDLLLVAGDLFSELARPEALREAIRHLQDTFADFLKANGTILAITGNHDNENFCQTLRLAMNLAAPGVGAPGDLLPPGRLYLADEASLLRLPDPAGGEVQFVLMPYPTPSRFLTDESLQRFTSLEEKNGRLMTAFTDRLRGLIHDSLFRHDVPSVLAAHIAVHGAQLGSRFRLNPDEDMVLTGDDLFSPFAYVALGHIHKPQAVGNRPHVRYSGSIERMDLGEKDDSKGVIVFDIGPEGITNAPRTLPLTSTPVYEVTITQPKDDLPTLRERYPDAERDLVNLHLSYTAGVDNLEEVLRELQAIFPRWYARDWNERGALGGSLVSGPATTNRSFAETVREYVEQELAHHPDDERAAVLARLDELLEESP